MKFRIILLVALAGIVPVLIMRGVFLTSYEKRAVEVRTAEIQNQCTILSNQLSSSGYLTGDTSETIRTELVQLSNIYSGRVMVIDVILRSRKIHMKWMKEKLLYRVM